MLRWCGNNTFPGDPIEGFPSRVLDLFLKKSWRRSGSHQNKTDMTVKFSKNKWKGMCKNKIMGLTIFQISSSHCWWQNNMNPKLTFYRITEFYILLCVCVHARTCACVHVCVCLHTQYLSGFFNIYFKKNLLSCWGELCERNIFIHRT